MLQVKTIHTENKQLYNTFETCYIHTVFRMQLTFQPLQWLVIFTDWTCWWINLLIFRTSGLLGYVPWRIFRIATCWRPLEIRAHLKQAKNTYMYTEKKLLMLTFSTWTIIQRKTFYPCSNTMKGWTVNCGLSILRDQQNKTQQKLTHAHPPTPHAHTHTLDPPLYLLIAALAFCNTQTEMYSETVGWKTQISIIELSRETINYKTKSATCSYHRSSVSRNEYIFAANLPD